MLRHILPWPTAILAVYSPVNGVLLTKSPSLLVQVEKAAEENNLKLKVIDEMPANNLLLVFTRD
jgi:hypothetical protein